MRKIIAEPLQKIFPISTIVSGTGLDYRAHEVYSLNLSDTTATITKSSVNSLTGNHIVGSEATIRKLAESLSTVPHFNVPVIILGETGTGKCLIAKAVHAYSSRRDQVLAEINSAALNNNGLAESQLFGHLKGAFTNATETAPGIIFAAHRGTLFLDEINLLPDNLQRILLKFLENYMIIPVGSATGKKVDVRVIFASNENLAEVVKAGKMREDFYYRINVMQIKLEPLRGKKEDILALACYFLSSILSKYQREDKGFGKHIRGFSPQAISQITNYPWPGNARELENMITRAVFTANRRDAYINVPLPTPASDFSIRHAINSGSNSSQNSSFSDFKKGILRDHLPRFLCAALNDSQSLVFAAKKMEMSSRNLHLLKDEYDLRKDEYGRWMYPRTPEG